MRHRYLIGSVLRHRYWRGNSGHIQILPSIRWACRAMTWPVRDRHHFRPGTKKNAVCAGTTQLDLQALDRIAETRPGWTVHVIGRTATNPPQRANLKFLGEQEFETVLAHVAHADVGLAPYLGQGRGGISDSKFKQNSALSPFWPAGSGAGSAVPSFSSVNHRIFRSETGGFAAKPGGGGPRNYRIGQTWPAACVRMPEPHLRTRCFPRRPASGDRADTRCRHWPRSRG